MSDDPGDLIADAIVSFVNDSSRGYSIEFNAGNPDDPTAVLNLDGSGEAHRGTAVFFVPVTEQRERLDGCAVNTRPGINMFVSRYLDVNVDRRQMSKLTREIYLTLENEDMVGFTWEATELTTKFDPDQLATQNRFLSVTNLTYFDIE